MRSHADGRSLFRELIAFHLRTPLPAFSRMTSAFGMSARAARFLK